MAPPNSLRLLLLSPEQPLLDDTGDRVTLPLYDGSIGIYPGHAPFLGRLGYGELRFFRGDQEDRFYVGGGFLEIADNRVTILSDEARPTDDLDRPAIVAELAEVGQRPAVGDEGIDQRQSDLDRLRAQLRLVDRPKA